MEKRHILAIPGLLAVTTIAIGIATFETRKGAFVNATECEHEGFHYSAKAADIDEHGHKEFWACCKCHETFLSNPGGTFVDADDSTMSGGMAPSHVAYIPSELEGLAAEAVVKSYSPYSYYGEKTTYEFDIIAGTTDLIATNATVASAYSTVCTDAVAHKADRTQVEEDYATYREVLVEEYGKSMVQQVTNVLIGTYGVVNQGVLATEVSNGHINCGIGEPGPGVYATWVAVNPTDLSWAAADNRYWIPSAYMGNAIINYAESVRASLTTMSAIETQLDALMLDCARSAAQFIMEAEMHYAFSVNGHLTYNGDTGANEWWFVWTYFGTEGLANVSCDTSYDPSTCHDYRLCAALYNPSNGDFSTTLSSVIFIANHIIANQVDDMF